MIGFPKIVKQVVRIDDTPLDIFELKNNISKCGPEFTLKANNFRGILEELEVMISSITEKFNIVFGENIFG